jgi:Leucine-rich repeat (LRR) protein
MNTQKLLVMITLSIITLLASCAGRWRYADENDFTVVLHDKTVEITGYAGSHKDVRIPPRIGRLPVTTIGKGAFYAKGLTGITIPQGVAVIELEAFRTNKLTSVTLPSSITHIGEDAFRNNKLASVTIPEGVVFIEGNAFMSNDLTHVTIPNSVTEIGYAAFAFNDLVEINIPNRITSIAGWAFRDNRLTGITIPEGVVSIGYSAFENNNLTEIIIPESVTFIDRGAFDRDVHRPQGNNITKITIGENVELKYDAFPKFSFFYNDSVMKRGGTYIFNNYHWSPEDKTIPVLKFTSYTSGKFPDILFFADMPDLEYVELSENDLLTDITPLSGLTKLRELRVYDCPNIKSLEPLSSLTNLKSLTLNHNNYDYGMLVPLQQLETLIINSDEADINPVGQLYSLKTLYIISGNLSERIMNINELQNLVNLEKLSITGIGNLDLSWASGLRNLTDLELTWCTIVDVSPLANLPNLINVSLEGSRIRDITPLLYSNSIKYIRALDVDTDINDNIRSRFDQRKIYLDTFSDTR